MNENTVYYAIGDVHGMADRLQAMHARIRDDMERLLLTDVVIVHLGDYVDRGPDSRGVIDQIIALEAISQGDKRLNVISLIGNHERMMLDAIGKARRGAREHWELNGGDTTVKSYRNGGHKRDGGVDPSHLHWVETLKTMHWVQERNLVFVHAGINPNQFPECPDEVRLWTRSAMFFDDSLWPDREELKDLMVVHGHTPTMNGQPDIGPRRINVDTGAVYGGPLTSVVLAPGEEPRFLAV